MLSISVGLSGKLRIQGQAYLHINAGLIQLLVKEMFVPNAMMLLVGTQQFCNQCDHRGAALSVD